MSQVNSTAVLLEGLRADFWDTYSAIRNRLQDSRLAGVMDLGVQATNREHTFGYFNAPPHVALWERGQSIPEASMDSESFSVPVYKWGQRIKWLVDDREDDQTQSLEQVAQGTAQSLALLPERFFFDLLADTASPSTLPAVPTSPDGVAMFSATDGNSADRFGVSGGNIVAGTGTVGIGTSSEILTDYYSGLTRFMAFQDGQGQPLHLSDVIAGGVTIIYPSSAEKVFDEAFRQLRQGVVLGTDAGTTPSNVVLDSSRNVQLWSTPRLTGDDWYMFLNNAPKPATFFLDRKGVVEETSMEGNGGDLTRTTGIEYVQWHSRSGAGISLPYGAVKVNNT